MGNVVAQVHVDRPDIVHAETDAPHTPLQPGCRIVALHRHGKQMVIETRSHGCMLVHLGMSGSMRLLDQPPVGETHVHAWWRLEPANGSMFWMRHRDPRRFGWLESHASLASVRERRWSLLGPDALGVTADALNACLAGTRRPLKSALLDQTCVAGLGNIYVDEALFRAGLHPCTRTHRLQERHVHDLARAITSILRKAVERGGSTIQDHRGADGTWGSFQKLHRVYGRAGLPCVRCGSSLRRRLVSQRTTVFCPDCQPTRPR